MKFWYGVLILFSAASLSAEPQWLAPIQISDVPPPTLSADARGNVAIVYATNEGTSSGTLQHPLYPSYWRTSIHAMFSSDRGLSWSAPQEISDSSLWNHQPDVVAGQLPGEFFITWASGDAFSGYRQHVVRTTDNGASFTSSTRTQTFFEPGQGVVFPDIEMAGESPVITWSGVDQVRDGRPNSWYAAKVDPVTLSWSEPAYLQTPYTTGPLSRRRPTSTGGQTVIAAGAQTSSSLEVPGPEIFVVRSDNGGTTWSEPNYIAENPKIYTHTPNVATDGSGTWIMMYFGGTKSTIPVTKIGRLFLQRSVDDGVTWSAPALATSTVVSPLDAPVGIAGNGSGRWIAVAGAYYTFSADDGLSWNDWIRMPEFYTQDSPGHLSYLGDGKWGLLERRWGSPRGLFLRTLQWGPSKVSDWTLY